MNDLYKFSEKKVYCALSSTAPNADGTNVTEPSDKTYSRAAVIDGRVCFAAGPFAVWGKVAYYAVYDSLECGNMLLYGTFDTPSHSPQEIRFCLPNFEDPYTTGRPTCETCDAWEEIEDGHGSCHALSAGQYTNRQRCPREDNPFPFPQTFVDDWCRCHQDFYVWLASKGEQK